MSINRTFTEQELLDLFDQCIAEYPTSKEFFTFWGWLNSKGIYMQYLNRWKNVVPIPGLKERFLMLKELEKTKLLEGLLRKDSNITERGAMFTLRYNHKAMEEEKKIALDIQKEKLKAEKSTFDAIRDNIQVTFSTVEHRTNEEINALINE